MIKQSLGDELREGCGEDRTRNRPNREIPDDTANRNVLAVRDLLEVYGNLVVVRESLWVVYCGTGSLDLVIVKQLYENILHQRWDEAG